MHAYLSHHLRSNKFYNVSVGLDSLTHDQISQISFSKSFRSAVTEIFEKRFQRPTSLLEAGQLGLEDLLVSFPNLPWADVQLCSHGIQLKKFLKPISSQIKIHKSRLSAPRERVQDSPEKYSTLVSYSTTGRRLVLRYPHDGGMRHVTLSINTFYSVPSLTQDGSIQRPRANLQPDPHDNLQSDWHQDGVRGVLSGGFDGLQDFAHRLLLKLWSINEKNALAMPLETVDVALQTVDPLSKPKESETRPQSQILVGLDRLGFERIKRSPLKKPHTSDEHTAYIALGSNVGNRMGTIELACNVMETQGIKIVRTSALYETVPMYYEKQQPFINGVCQVCQSI